LTSAAAQDRAVRFIPLLEKFPVSLPTSASSPGPISSNPGCAFSPWLSLYRDGFSSHVWSWSSLSHPMWPPSVSRRTVRQAPGRSWISVSTSKLDESIGDHPGRARQQLGGEAPVPSELRGL